MRLTFCYRHIAPYHHAQLNALAQNGHEVTVLSYDDFRGMAFSQLPEHSALYRIINIQGPEGDWDDLYLSLAASAPEIILFPGWGHAYCLAALSWGVSQQIPCVVISDSQKIDFPRHWLKEQFKRYIIRQLAAGFVAGKRSFEYLVSLGMSPEQIVTGCDVVDNSHFSRGAICVRENSVNMRKHLNLPENYFLAVNRLIPKKNVETILSAFSQFITHNIPTAWDLVIVGDGPLRHDLIAEARSLGIEHRVHFVSSQTYQAMPTYYGLASTFILASAGDQWGLVVNEAMASCIPVIVSERCGCAPDLVQEGVNGFTFAPHNSEKLAKIMRGIADGRYDGPAMGRNGQKAIKNWSLDRFVESLNSVAVIAKGSPPKRQSLFDGLVLKISLSRFRIRRGSS